MSKVQLVKKDSETIQQLGNNLVRLPTLNEVLRCRVIPRPLADSHNRNGWDKKRGVHPLSQSVVIEMQEQTHDSKYRDKVGNVYWELYNLSLQESYATCGMKT